jgi:hypothetical protein
MFTIERVGWDGEIVRATAGAELLKTQRRIATSKQTILFRFVTMAFVSSLEEVYSLLLLQP